MCQKLLLTGIASLLNFMFSLMCFVQKWYLMNRNKYVRRTRHYYLYCLFIINCIWTPRSIRYFWYFIKVELVGIVLLDTIWKYEFLLEHVRIFKKIYIPQIQHLGETSKRIIDRRSSFAFLLLYLNGISVTSFPPLNPKL